jgi:hypothetical protein
MSTLTAEREPATEGLALEDGNDVAREHPNARMIRRGYEAVEHGDIQALDEMFTDDVTWYGLPGSQNVLLSRDYEGKEAVFGLFGELGARSSGTLRRDVQDVIANDRWAVAWVKESGERETGARVWDELQIFTFSPGGKIKDFRGLPFDMTVVDEFWS